MKEYQVETYVSNLIKKNLMNLKDLFNLLPGQIWHEAILIWGAMHGLRL